MMKFFAKCFDTACCILAVVNWILWGFFGYILGNILIMKFLLYGTEETVVKIFLICWGVIIGFLVNTVIFGFIAQFIEMRKDLDKLVDNID